MSATKPKYPYRVSMTGLTFFCSLALTIGLIVGLFGARYLYREAPIVEERMKAQRALRGQPIELAGSEFLCTVLVAGMGGQQYAQTFEGGEK